MTTESPLDMSVPELVDAVGSERLRRQELLVAFESRESALDRGEFPVRAVLDHCPDPESLTTRGPGPLEGLPVLVKGNITVGDLGGASCTAGSLALEGFAPPAEAPVVTRLRAAGAMIMGTANLSEWANFRSLSSTSGWSARGGLTLNPHGRGLSACGSSSGSAAAVAGGLVRVALGTETDGSICCPASVCGVVGWKPTVGLVTTEGVVPVSHRQDSVGVLAASMTDLLPVADVLLGGHRRPTGTGDDALPLTVGFAEEVFDADPGLAALGRSFAETVASRGISVVGEISVPRSEELVALELGLLLQEFHHGIDRWLAALPQPDRPRDLASLISFNREHASREMRWFGQDLFEAAVETPPLDDPDYLRRVGQARRLAVEEGLGATFDRHSLDVIAVPVTLPARKVELGKSDPQMSLGAITAAAVAGWPVLTLVLGRLHDLPVGVGLVGRPGSDRFLLEAGARLERLLPPVAPPAR